LGRWVFRTGEECRFWVNFDVHAAVGKPGKGVLVEAVMRALDADNWQLKMR
jgi:hypothetical protein